MKNVGVIDIGSNTVVLIIYALERDSFSVLYHESSPVHLVSYQEGNVMKQEGIDKTKEVLIHYHDILVEKGITEYRGFITEPWRQITNAEEMKQAFEESGITIDLLSGYEEAAYDFMGSRFDVPEITTGNAFDVGGGSTELISFKDNEIIEAVSFPLGCVRLSALPLNIDYCMEKVRETLQKYPQLTAVPDTTIIGIGGTARAAGQVCDEIFHTGNHMRVADLRTVYENLIANDEATVNVMHQTVKKGRWAVFLPGISMILAICNIYNVETIRLSTGCVREGFLMKTFAEE